MKFSQVLPIALALLEPASALVGIGWNVENVPEWGMKEITFPMNMANATPHIGFYFAQQFAFNGQEDVGYTGLQPTSGDNDEPIVHVAFSSFNEGTTTDHKNCNDGADGGPGVSCAFNLNVTNFDHTYLLNVKNTEGTKWVGTLIDAVTSEKYEVGSWSLSSGAKGIQGSYMGFIEYFAGVDECGDLPKTQIFFGNPISSGLVGTVDLAYEYGDCVEKSGFETHYTKGGVEAQCGFEGKEFAW